MIQVIATTRSGLMPDSSARSSLSEKARMLLPLRVRFRNQNSQAITPKAVTSVITVVVRIANPSARPVAALKAFGSTKNRAPSRKS